MGAPEYMDNAQGELEINRYYWFLLLKTTTMPDGIEYYVMEDIYGNKHLMEKEPYESYGFKLGEKAEIRIDKVNCRGKVFFEPKHPRYNLGSTVKTKFVKHDVELDKFKEKQEVLIVEDPDGNLCSVKPINGKQKDSNYQTDYLMCIVDKISKGRLILSQIG